MDWGDDVKEPVKSIDLSSTEDPLAVQCISFQQDETNNFFIGGENSSIYHTRIHTRESDDHHQNKFEGHFGSVMAIDAHPKTMKNSEVSHLLLSCGVDWKLGLWHAKKSAPILMNELETEIYDVRWSPAHPGVFATADGEGHIDLWDLSKPDPESYRYRKEVEGKRAINKLRWTHDGRKLLTGDSSGVVKLWNVDKDFWLPRDEDLAKIEHLLSSA